MRTYLRTLWPGEYSPILLRVFATFIVLSTLTRLAIASRLETTGWGRDPLGMIESIGLGLVADAASGLVFCALALVAFAMCSRRGLRGLGHLGFVLTMIVLVFGAVSECFFWEEFASRLNGVAVFYLMFPREVIGNLRESFDLSTYLPIIGALGLALWWYLRVSVHRALNVDRQRFHVMRAGLAAFAMAVLGVTTLSVLPRQASANRELNELALNGPANMIAAALTNDSQYDGVYPGIDEREALPLLREIVHQDNTVMLDPADVRSIRRAVDNGPGGQKLNIVVVIEESFGSNYVDSLDRNHAIPISPNLDRLAKQGLFFTNVYASGQRSVRGLEAVLTSFTPIPGISTARRPGSQGMHSLPNTLRELGYQSAMLYAGRAVFDNMGTFWEGIGFDHVWDQGDIGHSSFTTIWGVCDENLFAEALDRGDTLSADGRPFLLSMFTVSNHRPYKFPQDHVQWDERLGNHENTVRYADWAFANFIEQARRHPWFKDTVFVFVADHGRKVNGAAAVPLDRYRIPMLFYSPAHIAPRKVETLTAQIDLAPTLLGVLGLSYESHFFGIDVLREPPGGGRIAVAHNFSVAFATPGHAVVLEPTGDVLGYAFHAENGALEPETPDAQLDMQSRAVTQTAHRMFYAHQYHETPQRPELAMGAHLRTVAAGETNR